MSVIGKGYISPMVRSLLLTHPVRSIFTGTIKRGATLSDNSTVRYMKFYRGQMRVSGYNSQQYFSTKQD